MIHGDCVYLLSYDGLDSIFRYPTYFPIFQQAMTLWYNDPSVTSPLLKLLEDMVTNEAQRLLFPISSAGGILLVREACGVITTYGKLTSTLLTILMKALAAEMSITGFTYCLAGAVCGRFVVSPVPPFL